MKKLLFNKNPNNQINRYYNNKQNKKNCYNMNNKFSKKIKLFQINNNKKKLFKNTNKIIFYSLKLILKVFFLKKMKIYI